MEKNSISFRRESLHKMFMSNTEMLTPFDDNTDNQCKAIPCLLVLMVDLEYCTNSI